MHLLPAFGDKPLASIRPRDVQSLVNTWNEKSKPRTVRRQYDVLRAVFAYAVDQEYVARAAVPEREAARSGTVGTSFLDGRSARDVGAGSRRRLTRSMLQPRRGARSPLG